MMGAGFGLLASCLGLVIALLIGSAVVRGAVSIANWLIGPVKTDDFGQWDDWDSDDEPAYIRKRRRGGQKAIPEPGLGTGMLIAFITTIVNLAINLGALVIMMEAFPEFRRADESARLALSILLLPVSFLAMTILIRAILSTTFWRAAAVSFLCYLIVAVTVGLVIGAVYVAWEFSAPGRR
jgi:hypothetical protein